jgi:hypothetical protein
VLDILVPKMSLKGARVVALVGQREAAGMAQRMRVRLEAEGRSTNPADKDLAISSIAVPD